MSTPPLMRALAAIAAPFVLAACANFPDAPMSAVSAAARSELGKDVAAVRNEEEAKAARDKIAALLRRALSADETVQIALLNNRGLQAAFNDLFVAEAEAREARLPPNPTFSITRLVSRPEVEIERQIAVNILALVTLPARSAIARERLHTAQLRATEAVMRIAAETRQAYYRAVAAQQTVNLLAQSQAAALAATQLARRLGETGAMNKLDQAREQVFYAELTGQLAIARQRARSERERLVRTMGLWGDDLDFRLPATLPAPPRQPQSLPLIEQEAIRRRVDLQTARADLEVLATSLGLTRATRYVSLFEARGRFDTIRERERGQTLFRPGFELEVSIPIYDFGEAKTRQAEETYLAALNRLADKAVAIRSEARAAYRNYRAAYDIARHYSAEVLQLRKIIADELLLRYNAMQIDVFELLAEARQRVAAHVTAIEALRDFWLAEAAMTAAIVGGGNSAAAAGDRTPSMPESSSSPH